MNHQMYSGQELWACLNLLQIKSHVSLKISSISWFLMSFFGLFLFYFNSKNCRGETSLVIISKKAANSQKSVGWGFA